MHAVAPVKEKDESPSGELRFFSHPKLPRDEFPLRWELARRSAFRGLLDEAHEPKRRTATEEELLRLLPPEKHEAILRAVFDNGHRLGTSLSRYLGLSADAADFRELFAETRIPCFRGAWGERAGTLVHRRERCEPGKEGGSIVCDYWREALDGLVCGASDQLRMARHRSAGHGDGDCFDLIFPEAGAGPVVGMHRGPVPPEWRESLKVVAEKFAGQGVSLFWDGVSEGTLFMRMEAGASPLCGAGGRLMFAAVEREVQALLPGVRIRDGAPLAVYGGAE